MVTFGLAWWLGLYLLARDPGKPLLRRTGLGLLGYGIALAADELGVAGGARLALLCLPALAWTGVLVLLLPENVAVRVDRWWLRAALPLTAVAVLAAALTGARYPWYAVVLLPLAAALVLLLRSAGPRGTTGVVILATLLFGLGIALLLLAVPGMPRGLLLAAIGFDLVLLGLCVAVLDAFDEGQALRPDMLRSLLVSAATAVLFGGQVALAGLLGAQAEGLLALLYGVVAAAITIQVVAGPIQSAVDRLAFTPRLSAQRAQLRGVAEALPRRAAVALAELDEAEFARLTRRALSHYGDLGKLVSSPLTALPQVDRLLAERGTQDTPMEREVALKAVLLAGINRLKPPDGQFGTSEEWRYYNSLYFYYVIGIRPYSVRTKRENLDEAARQALSWFANQVPERTLHNWQNAAAKLVAAELRTGLPAPEQAS